MGDLEAAHSERFGHFEADVASSYDDCRLGLVLVEVLLERERVAHRVQQVHAVVGAELVKP